MSRSYGANGVHMAYETTKVWELVDQAVSHKWSVPEFQRGFVWKPIQVRDLAESLFLEYPVGSILVWKSQGSAEERVAKDAASPSLWIVDGQQRTTALCLLFGRKPYWWATADEWNKDLKRYDIRFDIHTKEEPFFLVANAAIRSTKSSRYIPLRDLLVLDTSKPLDMKALQELAEKVKVEGLCDGMNAMEVYTQLDRVRQIRYKELVTVTIQHDLEDVVEIFDRLNSRGTRVTEADVYLGIVASRNPGWVREEFLPFLKSLGEDGFNVEPNLLFRSLAAVGIGRTRFKEISDDFWEAKTITEAWTRTRGAWERLLKAIQGYGVLSDDLLPTATALVTLTALLDRFPRDPRFDYAFYWFIQASRFGRYSGSGTTTLEEDLRDVRAASSITEAVVSMMKRFESNQSRRFEPIDFDRDYTDGKFGRFLLYLLVYRNRAQDWEESGSRLGFDGAKALARFWPQWHHIYPRKFLEGKVLDDATIDSLANIAVIGENINIRISKQDPMKYLDKYNITDAKLLQQFIELKRTDLSISNYPAFLDARSKRLAEEANRFLEALSEGLPAETRPLALHVA